MTNLPTYTNEDSNREPFLYAPYDKPEIRVRITGYTFGKVPLLAYALYKNIGASAWKDGDLSKPTEWKYRYKGDFGK